jgi:hypothetical protein
MRWLATQCTQASDASRLAFPFRVAAIPVDIAQRAASTESAFRRGCNKPCCHAMRPPSEALMNRNNGHIGPVGVCFEKAGSASEPDDYSPI